MDRDSKLMLAGAAGGLLTAGALYAISRMGSKQGKSKTGLKVCTGEA